jgi:hypothetical protein
MGSRLPPRKTTTPTAVPAGTAEADAAQGVVVDWRRALADYLQALQKLGDQQPQAGGERPGQDRAR